MTLYFLAISGYGLGTLGIGWCTLHYFKLVSGLYLAHVNESTDLEIANS